MRLKTNSGSSKRPTERREDAVTPHMHHHSEGNSSNIKNEQNRSKTRQGKCAHGNRREFRQQKPRAQTTQEL